MQQNFKKSPWYDFDSISLPRMQFNFFLVGDFGFRVWEVWLHTLTQLNIKSSSVCKGPLMPYTKEIGKFYRKFEFKDPDTHLGGFKCCGQCPSPITCTGGYLLTYLHGSLTIK